MTSLDGRVVAIAGAGGGLGPTVARVLAEAGASLALNDRSAPALSACVDGLAVAPERVHRDTSDLLDPDAVQRWATAASTVLGPVDALVHLVGGWRGGRPLAEGGAEDWAALEPLLVRTVQHTSSAFRASLAASEHGRFVLVSAKQAVAPSGSNAGYAAAKAAAEAWTFALADDLAETAATANVVAVNMVVTPKMRQENPGKTFATGTDTGEIAQTIAWLLSDAARKTSGQRIALHGR